MSPTQIEHDADEPPRDTSKSPWFAAGVLMVLLWSGYLYLHEFVWQPIGLGFLSGMLLACWAIDVSGNKLPKSWRG